MSYTLGQVKSIVRSLVDDPGPSWCADDFVIPLINKVYKSANLKLVATQGSWDIDVVEVPGVTAGTPNMVAYQTGDGLIANLTDQPLRIDWKPAGNPSSQYQLVTNYEVLPDIQPPQFPIGWEYRSQVIWLTPCTIDVDLRVRGEFAPPALTNDNDVLISHPLIGSPVAYGVASLCGVVRGNKGWEISYAAMGQEEIDDILQEIVRSEQGNIRRIGSQTRGRGRGYGNFAGY